MEGGIKVVLHGGRMGGEFWAAIAGAIVGGAISFIMQRWALTAANKQREQDRSREQQALGHALLLKTIRIHSNNHHLHTHIEESLNDATARGFDGEPWQVVKALANAPPHVHFSTDEMVLLLELKEDGVVNALLSLDVIHNSLIDAFVTFGGLRNELTGLLPAIQMVGAVGTAEIPSDKLQYIRPKMVEINLLIRDLQERSGLDLAESAAALKKLQEILRNKLGLAYALEATPKK